MYLGIFKGRPVKFNVDIIAPISSGVYETHWRMLQEGVKWFGEEITNTINVFPIPEPGIFIVCFWLGLVFLRDLKK